MSVLYFVSQAIVFDSAFRSEKECAEDAAQRFMTNLDINLQDINSTAEDWAIWGDTCSFVENNDTAYIDSHLADLTFINLHLNMMFFVNQSRQAVFSKVVDLENQTSISLSEAAMNQILSNDFLFTDDPAQDRGGFILLDGAPMLVVAHPILNSLHEGPIRGTLIMGRYFDKTVLNALSDAVGLPIEVVSLESLQMPADFHIASTQLSLDRPVFNQALNESYVASYVLVKDVGGAPILITRLDSYRSAYLQGKISMLYTGASFGVIGVIVFASAALMLEKMVLFRLRRLNYAVIKTGESNDFSKRVIVDGADELSKLACNINRMLDVIEKSRAELKDYAQTLETRVQMRTKELSENQEKLKSILSASPDAIVATDLDGKIIETNQQMTKLYGLERADLVGKWALSFVAEKDCQRLFEQVEKVIAGEIEIAQFEGAICKKNGVAHPAELSISVIKDSKGVVAGFVAIIRDVTEKKQIAQRLFNSERLAAIGATAGMVGHDIRNPLHSIIGDVYLLKSDVASMPEGETKESVKESLASIENNIDYINKIVADLQDYSRPLKPEFVEVDIKSLVTSSLSLLNVPRNIDAFMNLDEKLPKLKTDPLLFKRVLMNLATNAIQAMQEGGKLTITASYQDKDETVQIIVADTGVGISADIQDRLFTPLFTTKPKGQGFGLIVVKRLTEALGGTITFDSQQGKGTKFIVSLPAYKS